MVAINKILLPECTGERFGGGTGNPPREARLYACPPVHFLLSPFCRRSQTTRGPIGYQGGGNLYGHVNSSPGGNVDAEGLSERADVQTLDAEIASWNKEGHHFASSLLGAFLSQQYAGGNAGLAFQKYAPEIKGSKYYRSSARAFLDAYVKKYFVAHQRELRGNVWVRFSAPRKQLYVQFYFDNLDTPRVAGDLTFALGGALFKFNGTLLARVDCAGILFWKTSGLRVSEPDDYSFPNYTRLFHPVTWAKELFAQSNKAFRAGRDLEANYGYSPFSHTEKWSDSFHGTSLVPLRQWAT